MQHLRTRGLIGVHASGRDSTNLKAFLDEINTGFETFKERHDERLGRIEKALDETVRMQAALQVGGDPKPGAIAHGAAASALTTFMRTGDVSAIAALGFSASMSSDSNPDGGYSVPKEIDRVIQSQMLHLSPMRRLALVVRTGTQDYSKMINRRGASSGWVSERADRPETDSPNLAQITPPIGELYAQPEITARLLDDSIFDLDAFLSENVSEEFGLQEGAAFTSGNGIQRPRGFLTYPTAATADATREFGTLQHVPSGVAGALTDANNNGMDALMNIVTALKPAYRAGPGVAWTMNAATSGIVQKLKDSEGRYLWRESLTAGAPATLLGYPVELDENMPDVAANAFPIAFGNFQRGYVIVDRSETRLLRDPYTKKGWIRFYFTKRVGGSVTDSNAIKLLRIATS